MRVFRCAVVGALLAGALGCHHAKPARAPAHAAATAPGWRLVWADEFEKPGLPDSSRWTYEEGLVRNREAQYYTRARRENARVEDGMLVIEARRERHGEAQYTSASLTTEGRASRRYGRIEVRSNDSSLRDEWTKDRIDVSVDGATYFTFRNTGGDVLEWPFDAAQYLNLNVAVSGAWGGQRGIDDSIFPQRFYVDYVRVYQRPD